MLFVLQYLRRYGTVVSPHIESGVGYTPLSCLEYATKTAYIPLIM